MSDGFGRVPMPSKRRPTIQIAQPSTGEEEWQALREPLMTGWLTQGPKVAEFETGFAQRHGVEHAIAASSCTTALHLILLALEIGPGDEVILPAFTWVATANVVLHCGATPVLVDVDRETFNIDVARIAEKLTGKTRAIMPVHLFGRCAQIDAIRSVVGDLPIVEDAACAAGASYQGRPAGSLGTAGAFSFHPRKSITTGEGGMVTTNSQPLAERVRALRNHGASMPEEERHRSDQPHQLPEFNRLGYNYRMTDLQGAVGVVQLAKLDRLLKERRAWAAYYTDELKSVPWLRTPSSDGVGEHGWQAYVGMVDADSAPLSRDGVMDALQQSGISSRPGTHAIHTLGYYRERYGFGPDDFPAARDCDRNSLAIPLHNRMTDDDYQAVVAAIKEL